MSKSAGSLLQVLGSDPFFNLIKVILSLDGHVTILRSNGEKDTVAVLDRRASNTMLSGSKPATGDLGH